MRRRKAKGSVDRQLTVDKAIGETKLLILRATRPGVIGGRVARPEVLAHSDARHPHSIVQDVLAATADFVPAASIERFSAKRGVHFKRGCALIARGALERPENRRSNAVAARRRRNVARSQSRFFAQPSSRYRRYGRYSRRPADIRRRRSNERSRYAPRLSAKAPRPRSPRTDSPPRRARARPNGGLREARASSVTHFTNRADIGAYRGSITNSLSLAAGDC